MRRRSVLTAAAVVVAAALGVGVGHRLGADDGTQTSADRPVQRFERAAWTQEWAPGADRIEVVAAPDGTGTACTHEAPCSLIGARDEARRRLPTADRDLAVVLTDGTYLLSDPLVLDGRDSGLGGHLVSWEAAPGAAPTLSGGVAVTAWVPDEGEVWSAPVRPGLDTRQVYVEGRRATRARGPFEPGGWVRTDDGFRAPDEESAAWAHPEDAEIVSFQEWKAFRCPVAAASGRDVVVARACWANATSHEGFTMDEMTWVEGAAELLDEPGEWHLDTRAGRLRYRPLPGQDMTAAEVVVATAPALVVIAGTAEAPVHDLGFRGLTFAHATWLGPSSEAGYATTQAGWHLPADAAGPLDIERTPGALTVSHAHHVRLEGNRFEHLGGVAIDLMAGSQDVGIVGNRLRDVSGSAITAGEAAPGAQNPPPRDQVDRLHIADNLIDAAGAEYADAPGIGITYASNVSLLHNELRDLPWSGISLGWGWGTPSYARGNVVNGNLIDGVVHTLADGGAIYTLSPMPETVIERNVIRRQRNRSGALFLDEGTSGVTVADNVVIDAPRWLHIWTASIHDNVVVDNHSDTDEMLDAGTGNVVADNRTGTADWSDDAAAVIAGAGLEPGYESLRDG